MRTFSPSDLKTFEQLAKLTQPALKRVVSRFLRKHYKHVVETKDYVFAAGDIPIALCAHLDTVFTIPPDEIYFDSKKNVMWSPEGLGADDRAGVYAILQIIRSGLRPHIIFTTDEEKGGLGAMCLAQLDCPFKDLRYIIQLDRRGSDDCVFYQCDNPQFVNYVESFGFSLNFGTFSDISTLCPAWKVAGVNLSVGYRDEHSALEVLFVGQLLATIEKVKHMLKETDIPYFEYIPDVKQYSYYDFYDFDSGYSTYGSQIIKCHHCGKYFMEEELIPVMMQNKLTKFFCPDCLTDRVAWCDNCNEAFEKISLEAPDTGLCPVCADIKRESRKNGFDPRAL